MKNFKFKIIGSLLLIVALLGGILSSCTEDDGKIHGTRQLVIDSVSKTLVIPADGEIPETVLDSATTLGFAGQTFIIRGKGFGTLKKLYFNDFDTYFNPTLITDEVIFVTIDRNTPYADVPNKLKLVTEYSTATYDFVVGPPAPGFHSFNPINAADGEEITIYGSSFLDPIVKVGGVEAQIVSNTLTEIKAILPAGSQLKKVSVSTIAGTTVYNTSIGTAIFDDAFYSPWTIEAWNNHEFVSDVTKSNQGLVFIKKTMNGYDNIQGNWAWNDQLSGYTGIKFAIRSEEAGKLKLVFNGDWGETRLFETTKEWKEYRYTWEQLGNPAAFQNLSFQEFSGSTNTYYIDNITYTVD